MELRIDGIDEGQRIAERFAFCGRAGMGENISPVSCVDPSVG